MANEVQQIEEQNQKLRDQIEEVQQERRAGFADAQEMSRALSAYEENARLEEVLKSQQDVLAREQKIRDNMLNDEPVLNDAGLPLDTPYTYSPDGPIVSSESKASEEPVDTADTPDVDAPASAPSVPSVSQLIQARNVDTDADDKNEEN